MKAAPISVKQLNAPMPKSVKKAFGHAGQSAWDLALAISRKVVESETREKATAGEAKINELTAANQTQATELADTRLELQNTKVKLADANRQLAVQKEETVLTEINRAEIASKIDQLEIASQAVEIERRTLFAEIRRKPDSQVSFPNRQDNSPAETEAAIDPVPGPGSATARCERLLLDQPELIEALTVIIKAVCGGLQCVSRCDACPDPEHMRQFECGLMVNEKLPYGI